MKQISSRQFAMFRIALGAYLTLHFIQLFPYGPELFSNHGMIPDARLNLTYAIFPNPLARWDSPEFVSIFLLSLVGLSFAFACGLFRRTTAILLWFGWACLINRNNLIINPSMPYVGVLLLLSALVPPGEAMSVHEPSEAWHFPAGIYWAAWFLLAADYTYSGWMKLLSPSWIDGTALTHILNNPLARVGGARDGLLHLPPEFPRCLTWGSLAAEFLFLPLSCHRLTRMIAWLAMGIMQLAILLVVNFTDLTIAMLLVHLFTFDPKWLHFATRFAISRMEKAPARVADLVRI